MSNEQHLAQAMPDVAIPLPGPLDRAPIVSRRVAQSMLDFALADVDLGRFDLYVLRVVRGMDPFQVATVASILSRAQAAGRESGSWRTDPQLDVGGAGTTTHPIDLVVPIRP